MAYDRKQLVHTSGGLSPLPQSFEYNSADDVTAAGYFPKGEGVNAGDKLTKVNVTKDGTTGLVTARADTPYFMVADANGVLTATPFA